jgi:hypothetical protein
MPGGQINRGILRVAVTSPGEMMNIAPTSRAIASLASVVSLSTTTISATQPRTLARQRGRFVRLVLRYDCDGDRKWGAGGETTAVD